MLLIVGNYKYPKYVASDSIMFTSSFMKGGSLVSNLAPEDETLRRKVLYSGQNDMIRVQGFVKHDRENVLGVVNLM